MLAKTGGKIIPQEKDHNQELCDVIFETLHYHHFRGFEYTIHHFFFFNLTVHFLTEVGLRDLDRLCTIVITFHEKSLSVSIVFPPSVAVKSDTYIDSFENPGIIVLISNRCSCRIMQMSHSQMIILFSGSISHINDFLLFKRAPVYRDYSFRF